MHPVLRILALLALALFVQFLPAAVLAATTVVLGGIALVCCGPLFRGMLVRSRWLLLTLLLVFALTTPGEYLRGWPLGITPTYEGIMAGGLQLLRLVVMLAGLALLLGGTSREALMASLHFLLSPLRWLRLSPERLTARLWLTLHYVEQSPRQRVRWTALDTLALEDDDEFTVRLALPHFTWRDALMVAIAAAGLGVWLG